MKKLIIIGMGSIGKRYISFLQKNKNIELYAYREKGKETIENVQNVYSWDEVNKIGANIALITNPTVMHMETAIKCARMGIHLFIEKPLGMNLINFQELKRLVEKNNLTCYVAYNLRFHPGIERLKQCLSEEELVYANIFASSYLPFWRKDKDYSEGYSAKAVMGGGVLLDLSHEFDYISYVFGDIKDIKGYFGRISNLDIDCEDLADVVIRVNKDKRIQLHLDFCSLCSERTVKIITKEHTYKLDLIKNILESFEKNGAVKRDEYDIDSNYTYERQLEYFFKNIGNIDIMNNLDEASGLLEKIIGFKKAI